MPLFLMFFLVNFTKKYSVFKFSILGTAFSISRRDRNRSLFCVFGFYNQIKEQTIRSTVAMIQFCSAGAVNTLLAFNIPSNQSQTESVSCL